MPCLDGAAELVVGEGGAAGDVGRSARNPHGDDAGGRRPAESDVGDHQLRADRAGEDAGCGLAAGGRRGNLPADLPRIEADPVCGDAVVGGEDDDRGARLERRRGSSGEGPPLDERLEQPEASGRLDELVGGVTDADRRSGVPGGDPNGERLPPARRDVVDARPCIRLDDRCARRRTVAPALSVDHLLERRAPCPAGGLEAGPERPLVGVAETEPGDGHDLLGQREQLADELRAVERDPADPDALGARRQPEVLDGAGCAVEVGVGDRVAAEYLCVAVAAIAADDDADGRLADPLDLQVEELPCALVEVARLDESLLCGVGLHGDLGRLALDDDEVPGLAEADRGGRVRRTQQAAQELLG